MQGKGQLEVTSILRKNLLRIIGRPHALKPGYIPGGDGCHGEEPAVGEQISQQR